MNTDLAKRLVRYKRWRWMDGMLGLWPDGTRWGRFDAEDDTQEEWRDYVPDLADPATQGCLWAMLADACGDFERVLESIHDHEYNDGDVGTSGAWGEALAEAVMRVWGEP